MKITFTSTDGQTSSTVLGDDDAQAYVTAPDPDWQYTVQAVPSPGASFMANIARGNASIPYRFSVSKNHATEGAAFQHCWQHAGLLPDIGYLLIERGGITVKIGATKEKVTPRQNGIQTNTVYQFKVNSVEVL